MNAASTSSVPFHAAIAHRWWRLAVYIYIPALVLTVATSLIGWDTAVQRAAQANNVSPSEVQTSLAISLVVAVVVQSGVAFGCWWMAGKLLLGSAAARMVLSVAAVVFVINAAATVAGVIGRSQESSTGVLSYVTAALIVIASIVAATATVQAYRGDRNNKFFVMS
nr:hypothetical protein [Corynebacterium lactis]